MGESEDDVEMTDAKGESEPDPKTVNESGIGMDDPKSSKPGPKKKGMAKAVPKPKRAKGSGGKRGGKATSGRKKDGGAPGAAAGASPTPGEDEEGADGESDEESDHGTYCICHGPDDHRWMICCDGCQDWFHGDCVGMDKYVGENLVQMYICPNCEDRSKRYVTRYKKLCALEGCNKPARIYNLKDASIFCAKEHCDQWWDQMIATLPQSANGHGGDVLTQSDFVGLLDKNVRDGPKDGAWKLGDPPFVIDDSFWDQIDHKEVLTHEELIFLNSSASDRYLLGEEIGLCRKQLQLLEMASERRKRIIDAAGPGGKDKDLCGYDYHLDAVGATAAFASFAKSPRGAAIFAAGRIDAPDAPPPSTDGAPGAAPVELQPPPPPPAAWDDGITWAGLPPRTPDARDWVCRAKRCKPHMAWYSGMGRGVRHTIKQLAAEAKEKLEAEAQVRECAAVRFRRKVRENNWVEVEDSDGDGAMEE